MTIFGGKGDGAAGVDTEVWDNDTIDIGTNVKVSVLATPCHTPGHVSFYAVGDNERAVFPGDT